MPDEVPSRAARSFSAIPALIVRQRPRGACRERRKRGQSGHEEDERFNTSGRGPRIVHERSPATLHLPSRPPNRFKNGISTSFWHVFASPRPEIPLFSGKFCLNVPHSTHRGLPRNCSSKAHRGLALEPGLGLVSPPMMGNFATASRRESDLFPPTRSQGAQRDPLGPRSRNRPRPSGWELESQIRRPPPCSASPL